MAHIVHEWIKRRQTSWPLGNAAGEIIVIGDPVEVGDWEEAVVQVDTLAITGSYNTGDIRVQLQTSISNDTHALWDAVFTAATQLTGTIDQGYIIKVTAASGSNPPDNSLRKWLRMVAIHNVATGGQNATVHSWLLLKKRTP